MRFGQLKKSIGSVTQKVYAELSPRVEYTLTPLGYSLKPVPDVMQTRGEEYKAHNS